MKPNKNTIKAWEVDASGIRGVAGGVVMPESVQQVKDAVKLNNRLVIRGGGTGLAGGCVPLQGQDVVLDLSKLNARGSFDKERKTIEVEAGVVLEDLNIFLNKYGLEFPVEPASHEVCTIGGMIATDAVGSRAIKYGSTSKWVKWVEVVDCGENLLRKGVTELSDYVGMEGITGVIVRACLKLNRKKLRTASLISKQNFDEVTEFVKELKQREDVSMIEFIGKNISGWLGLERAYHLIVEFESDAGGLSKEEHEKVWKMRKRIGPIVSEKGYDKIEDPKILIDKAGRLISWLEANQIPVFGHLGVGIFHPHFKKGQENLIRQMMKIIKKSGGLVSGEHGIGLLKKDFVEPNDKKILINVKKRTDEKNKFNVGKVI